MLRLRCVVLFQAVLIKAGVRVFILTAGFYMGRGKLRHSIRGARVGASVGWGPCHLHRKPRINITRAPTKQNRTERPRDPTRDSRVTPIKLCSITTEQLKNIRVLFFGWERRCLKLDRRARGRYEIQSLGPEPWGRGGGGPETPPPPPRPMSHDT